MQLAALSEAVQECRFIFAQFFAGMVDMCVAGTTGIPMGRRVSGVISEKGEGFCVSGRELKFYGQYRRSRRKHVEV